MRYSIIGFNQEKVIKTDLDLMDLLLLDYIIRANGNPNMRHIVKDDVSYVWLSHNKIHEDLPILRISEGTLRNRILQLKQGGWLVAETEKTHAGTMTYYSVTTLCTSLINDEPCHSKMTSNNITNNINKENTKVFSQPQAVAQESFFEDTFKETKKPKKNLYGKCMDAIEEFTEDEEVRNKLKDYLGIRLERKDTPLGIRAFQGMLKKLRELTESKEECLKIIQQSIDRSYLSFFPIREYKSYGKKTGRAVETTSLQLHGGEAYVVSDEEKEEIRRLVDSGELKEY